jgi:membrane dipeptidase
VLSDGEMSSPGRVRYSGNVLQSAAMCANGNRDLARARRLHQLVPVIDMHCDTTQRLLVDGWDFAERHVDGHIDIPRLREGGVGALFLAVWAPGPVQAGVGVVAARAQFGRIAEMVRSNNDALIAARTAADVRRAKSRGRIAVLAAVEGGYLIEDSLEVLEEYHRAGAVYMTLTHGFHTSWADSSGVHESLGAGHGGLTSFGREVVRTMNKLGMIVDVSHVSDDTFWDVMDVSRAPVVLSHSACRALSPHRRNVTDEMMLAVAGSGGAVHINFSAGFIDPAFPGIDPGIVEQWIAGGCVAGEPLTDHVTPLALLADHFDHALQVVGPDHVGIGSDFDGTYALPSGVDDCSRLPALTAELMRRGYDEADLAKVLGENTLRVMEACRDVADSLVSGETQ